MGRFTALTAAVVLFALHCVSAAPLHSKYGWLLNGMKEAAMKASSPELYLYSASLEAPADDDAILSSKGIRIINLGPVINHKGLDYAPTISADGKTLYYVSNRKGSRLTADKDPSHDFWAAKKNNDLDTVFFQPFNIDTSKDLGNLGVNTQLNEGAASIAADKQTLIFTGCNRADGLGDCDLYITEIDGDKWGKPKNLGRKVNSEWWDSQPAISPDKSRIYFCSNRPGPNGSENFDIWYTDYDFDTEEWKTAVNAGPSINTDGIENSPFIAADNATLFFASDGHKPNLGGTDFYVTHLENKAWSKPQNLGAPINTPQNEQFITLSASGRVLYFSSTRSDIAGYQGSLDIFMAFVPSFFRSTIVKGVVLDECTNANIPAYISIRNPITNTTYYDTLATGGKTEFEMVVLPADYGNPKDSIKEVKFEVTATNATYGKTTQVVTVTKPEQTKNREEAGKPIEVRVELKLGQRPVIGAEMAFADYITRVSKKNPELASWKGLLMEEIATIDLYPLLNYVFFDEGSATFPKRYTLFTSPSQTTGFSDERIPGGTLEKYYHVLNIFGYRMTKHPSVKVQIVGNNDNTTASEKSLDLSKQRAQIVYDYLKNIWNISPDRMSMDSRNLPKTPSTTGDKDPISKAHSLVENRRAELWFSGEPEEVWQVMRPILDNDPKIFPSPETMNFTMKNGIEEDLVASRRIEVTRDEKAWNTLTNIGVKEPSFTWDWKNKAAVELNESVTTESPFKARLVITSKNGSECVSDPITIKVKIVKNEPGRKIDHTGAETRETYNLILFPFDRYDAGPFNERILKEYVYPRCFPKSKIIVEGHTDIVGMFDHNAKLSGNRAKTVEQGVKGYTKGQFQSLESSGVGEEKELFTNELPEGRFYNRTVQIRIASPVEDEQ